MSTNCESNLSHEVSASIATEKDLEYNLLTLPDLPLLLILQNIPFQSLIDLELLHSRFVPFCDILLKQNHRLVLYLGDLESIQKFKCSFRIGIPFVDYLVDGDGKRRFCDPEFYRVHYVTLNNETVDKLVALMPAISHLEVIISEVNICLISRLIRLLTHWASTLKWLKVCSGDFQPEDSQHFHTLISAINGKLSFLEHLTLDLDGELLGKYEISVHEIREGSENLKLDLPILGQLKEFFIQTRDRLYLKILLNNLKFQPDNQLTAIGIGLPLAWGPHYPSNLINHPFATRFTLLCTRYEPPPYALTSLPNLTGLTVNWRLNQPLNFLTSELSSFKQLQYLELRRLPDNREVADDPFAPFPLPTVEILSIHINNSLELGNEHTLLEDDRWESLFPSVQIVNLIHLGDFCGKCYPEKKDGDCIDNPSGFSQTSERLSCLSHLLAPLTVLPSLRKIFYQRNHDLKNIAEFTGKGEFVKTHAYIH